MNLKRTLYELMMGKKAYLKKEGEPIYFRNIRRNKKMQKRYNKLESELRKK